MKIISISLLFVITSLLSFGIQKTTIYLLPGQGSDERLFDSLQFDSNTNVKYIEYEIPEKGTTMKNYVKTLASQINTTEKFILIGVSLGGMLCAELNEILDAEKVIIISSAKNKKDMPFRYRVQRILPFYKIIPPELLLKGVKFCLPFVETDRNQKKALFETMLLAKNPTYFKRTCEMMIKWERTSNTKNIIHIHGTSDHIIPIKNIKPDYIVEDGSHNMALTKAKAVNAILHRIMEERIEIQTQEQLLTKN